MAEPSQKPNTKGLYIKTYGCQMNVYDSERMADVLRPLFEARRQEPPLAEVYTLIADACCDTIPGS